MLPKQKEKIELKTTGFIKPTDDFFEHRLNLSDFFSDKPSTFFVRLAGHALKQEGIFHDDIAFVDRSISPSNGDIVLAVINAENICGKYLQAHNGVFIISDESKQPLLIDESTENKLWGVVISTIRRHRNNNLDED